MGNQILLLGCCRNWKYGGNLGEIFSSFFVISRTVKDNSCVHGFVVRLAVFKKNLIPISITLGEIIRKREKKME